MAVTTAPGEPITREQVLGTERRWRRFGKPVPAGTTLREDGSRDDGLFGPGSVVWEVLLHPASILLELSAQGVAQTKGYKPIVAGLRDRDPMALKARAGTLTLLDVHDRAARNSGMHAPMWLGDTATAQLMWKHLHQIHQRVTGDVIDVGRPELGGYAAASGRDAMWAALTEVHPLLRAYEAFAYRDGHRPQRLPDAVRDQYVREVGAYLRLVGAPEEDVPASTTDLAALYEKYAPLFAPSLTVDLMPDTRQHWLKLVLRVALRNAHPTHLRTLPSLVLAFGFELPMMGALSRKARRSMGLGPVRSAVAVASRYAFLPVAGVLQRQPRVDRYVQRLMWGPDAVELIDSARRLHAEELRRRGVSSAFDLVEGARA